MSRPAKQVTFPPKPVEVEIKVIADSDFPRRFGHRVRAARGSYTECRGMAIDRYITIPATHLDLIEEVVAFHKRDWKDDQKVRVYLKQEQTTQTSLVKLRLLRFRMELEHVIARFEGAAAAERYLRRERELESKREWDAGRPARLAADVEALVRKYSAADVLGEIAKIVKKTKTCSRCGAAIYHPHLTTATPELCDGCAETWNEAANE